MAKVVGTQRMVLQAILDLSKDSGGFVTDSQVAEETKIDLTDVRDCLLSLDGDCIEIARTKVGLSASITSQGRLALGQYRPFPSPTPGPVSLPMSLVDVRDGTDLWEEGIWDALLDYIEEQRVIPIIGPDLLQVDIEGKTVSLDRYLAGQLVSQFSLSPEMLPAEPSLNAVVCQLLRMHSMRRDAPYAAIRNIVLKTRIAPPKPLLQLAEIRHFNLFVTTTFDSLLEEAIDTVRFGGRSETVTIAYSPNNPNPKGLKYARESLDRPTVYHLLGKLSPSPVYVICDEDLLEFLYALQSETRRPEWLFDELEKNHLLMLGENFSDWLARFFLRAAKDHRLSDWRDVVEILADSWTCRDDKLALFLQNFSSRTLIFPGGGAIEFVDELWQRWQKRNLNQVDEPVPEMPRGAVFTSSVSGKAI